MITVAEMMTTNVQGLAEEDTLDVALHKMGKYGYHHIPVVRNESELVGLVTHRDVLAALGSVLQTEQHRITPDSVTMGEIMTSEVFTIGPQTSLRKAALYIRSQRYGCLPVVSDGKLVGIITDSDFVNICADLLEQLELVEPAELDQTET
jgi:CBS domain-containing membrane protein